MSYGKSSWSSLLWACLLLLLHYSSALSLRSLRSDPIMAEKKSGACHPYQPFQCPNGDCIPIRYLCDGSPDCKSGYDEDVRMCTAAQRPAVEETENFLKALLSSHGANFMGKIFGEKGLNNMEAMGGITGVAVALSESPTAEDFGHMVHMSPDEVQTMANAFRGIANGNTGDFTPDEAGDLQFYVDKLMETGFLN